MASEGLTHLRLNPSSVVQSMTDGLDAWFGFTLELFPSALLTCSTVLKNSRPRGFGDTLAH